MALPHGIVGWSAVSDCGISLTHLLVYTSLALFPTFVSAEDLCKQFWFKSRTDMDPNCLIILKGFCKNPL